MSTLEQTARPPSGLELRWVLPVLLLGLCLLTPARAQVVQTISGGRVFIDGPDFGDVDGPSSAIAQFHSPMGCALDASGNLFIADRDNNAVRRMDLAQDQTDTVIANLHQPVAVAFGAAQDLFVVNQADGSILHFDQFDVLYRFPEIAVDGLPQPTAIVIATNGTLYVTCLGTVSGILKKVDLVAHTINDLRTDLNQPRGVALMDDGSVAVSESGANQIRFFDPVTGAARGHVGIGLAGYRDGAGSVAQFNTPYQIAKAPNGNLVVADRFNDRVRLVAPNGIVTTLYGVDPSLWAGGAGDAGICETCVPMILPGWLDGTVSFRDTVEAREPVGLTVASDGTLYATEDYYHIIRKVTGTSLAGGGTIGGGTNQVLLPPVITPLSGFFPMGVDVLVFNPNQDPSSGAFIYYTIDGSDPGPNNVNAQLLFLTNGVATIHWQSTTRDLSSLRVVLFQGNSSSTTVSGQPVTINQVGTPSNLVAGSGATVLLPVVANLRANQTLKSIQFVATIKTVGSAPPIVAPIRTVAMTAADFLPVAAASPNLPFTSSVTVGSTTRLSLAYLGTNSAFAVQNFAAVAMLAISIPPNAHVGNQYTVAISSVTGTSDGVATPVTLTNLPLSVITVTNVDYLVGDTSPSGWYNAESFGDGVLENADVNNAFYASIGARIPPTFSDVFDAMDAFPEDTTGSVGGDGKIRFLDWQVLLYRSLGLNTNSWRRAWINGARVPIAAPSSGAPLSATAPQTAISGLQISVLQPQAELIAGSSSNVQPGSQVQIPLSVKIAPGASLRGMQFRVSVQPQAGAPTLVSPVSFVPASGLPQPISADSLPNTDAAAAWSIILNPFPAKLTGQSTIGTLFFSVPSWAAAGSSYSIRFLNADGAPDIATQYDFLPRPGAVGILSAAPAPPAHGFKLSWNGVAGQTYQIESTDDLASPNWRLEADGLRGRDATLDYVDVNAGDGAKFYRLRMLP